MLRAACFVDRDGCINANDKIGGGPKYVTKWEDFRFLPGAIEGLKLLAETEYMIIVVSNQSCIGRGLATHVQIATIFYGMMNEIQRALDLTLEQTALDWHYLFCPHDFDAGCACRKPKPGLIYKAAVEHQIDLSKSWMVGDSPRDMMAAEAAGIIRLHRLLIDPACLDQRYAIPRQARRIVANLYEAARVIVGGD